MQGPVDAASFVDAVVIGGIGVIVAGRQFAQRLLVRRVTVNFIRAHENERGFGTMLARGFQQIYRAERVHFKIQQGDLRRPCRGKAARRNE